MTAFLEAHRDNFTISTNPTRLNLDAICDFLTRAYWATGRPRERTERALKNSLVFGLYDGSRQIGLARVSSATTPSSPTSATFSSTRITAGAVSASG
ncbi:MAG: hypothetical protein ACOYZ8_17775 [Chloroflexota bacterium]